MKEYKITLDLVRSTKQERIYLKNDDLDSVKFIFELYNDGEIFDLTDVTSVRFGSQKPSGTTLFQFCALTEAEEGLCEVILTSESYNEVGFNLGEVHINKNGAIHVTPQFEFATLDSIGPQTTEGTGGSVYWTDILNKPLTFPPDAHTHAIADVTGLSDELATKLETIPAEYLTETEGDNRYELKGAGTGGTEPITGTGDPTIAPDFIGQIYINTTTEEAWIAGSATGNWQTISKDELGDAGTVTWTDVTEKPLTFTPEAHTHAISDVTNLQISLDGKSDVGHNHDTDYAAIAHTHAISDVTNLQTTLDGKSNTGHTHATADVTGLDTALAGKSDTGHTHAIADVTNLQTTLDGKSDTGHAHAISDVTNLQTTLDGLDRKPLRGTGAPTVTPEYIAQMYLDESTGDAYIANGLTSGDWRLISNETAVSWGEISGTLSSQTDLQNALDGKSDTTHNHDTAYAAIAHSHAISDVTNLQTTLDGKSDTTHNHDTTYAPIAHNHAIADVTNLQTTLDGKSDTGHTHTEADITFGAKNAKTYVDDGDNYILNTVLNGLSLWSGTQADYDALGTYDAATLYFVTG